MAGSWRGRAEKGREGERCSHGTAARQILGSCQKTFLERRRTGRGKRSRTRRGLVGKALSSFFALRIELAERSVWYPKHVPPRGPLPSRRPQTGAGLPGRRADKSRMLAWLLSHSAGGQSPARKPRLGSLFPGLLPNGTNRAVFRSLNFSHRLTKYFDAFG